MDINKTPPNIEVSPVSLGVMLVYWSIEGGLFMSLSVNFHRPKFACIYMRSQAIVALSNISDDIYSCFRNREQLMYNHSEKKKSEQK